MNKIRLIVHDYSKFSKHSTPPDFDFNCINMHIEHMQEHFTNIKRHNWTQGNKIQLHRLIAGGNVEIISHEQMYSIEDSVQEVPTFYLVTIPDIGGMFETGWIKWLPSNVKNFLNSTGIPILLSQPGEFGFEWIECKDDYSWVSQTVNYFLNRLTQEGIHNPVIVHNMSKVYLDLVFKNRACASVYSRQWIEHVKTKANIESQPITFDQHIQNINNKKVFFSSNRAPREARCLLLLGLLKHDNLQWGHISFLCEAPATVKLSREDTKKFFDSLFFYSKTKLNESESIDLLDKALDMLPLELDNNITERNNHVILNTNINQYRLNSIFEVVVETHDFTREAVLAGVLSEKVFWPILNQMPFIVLGHRENSRLLRELGFKTFDDDFEIKVDNASIFSQVDSANRVISRFSCMNKQEIKSWLESDQIRNKIIHNYNHLINTSWNQNEIDALIKSFRAVKN